VNRDPGGADRLVLNRPLRGATAAQWREYFDRTPMAEGMKAGFIRLYTDKTDYLAGVPVDEKIRRLRAMSNVDYLRKIARIHPDTVAYLVRSGSGDNDNQSAGPETYSAWYAWRCKQPGFDGLELPQASRPSSLTTDPGEPLEFPDGNAGVARLLVRWMIPDGLPRSTVCRWSHGYAGGSNELYDTDWSNRTDAPWVVGRQRFGRIAISNSDAAATSLTNAAPAQSHRAVMEILNDVVRPVYDFHWSERDTAGPPQS
jgi:hypothetical protein